MQILSGPNKTWLCVKSFSLLVCHFQQRVLACFINTSVMVLGCSEWRAIKLFDIKLFDRLHFKLNFSLDSCTNCKSMIYTAVLNLISKSASYTEADNPLTTSLSVNNHLPWNSSKNNSSILGRQAQPMLYQLMKIVNRCIIYTLVKGRKCLLYPVMTQLKFLFLELFKQTSSLSLEEIIVTEPTRLKKTCIMVYPFKNNNSALPTEKKAFVGAMGSNTIY